MELLAGLPDAAEARLRAGYEQLAAMGQGALLADTAGMLPRASCSTAGRLAEADAVCAVAQDAAADEDLTAQIVWRGARARLLADGRRLEEAEALAREGVRFARGHRLYSSSHTDALPDLGAVLEENHRAGGGVRRGPRRRPPRYTHRRAMSCPPSPMTAAATSERERFHGDEGVRHRGAHG